MRQNLRRPNSSQRERGLQTNRAQRARRARGFCFSSVAPNLWPTGDVLRAKAARVNYVIICIASAIPLKIHTAIVPIYICIYVHERALACFSHCFGCVPCACNAKRLIRRCSPRDKFESYCRRRINLHLPNCSFIIRLNYEQLCNCKGPAHVVAVRDTWLIAAPVT